MITGPIYDVIAYKITELFMMNEKYFMHLI